MTGKESTSSQWTGDLMDFKYSFDISDIDQHIAQIKKEPSSEMHNILYQVARKINPKTYLEVGVFKGRSMAVVLKASPQTNAYGIDKWGKHSGQITTAEGVRESLKCVGIEKLPIFYTGFSYEILPKLWRDKDIPEFFDLILVDGDHTLEGAKKDLDLCLVHLEKDGILIFHDIAHPSHPLLADLVLSFKRKMGGFVFIESYKANGFCLMTKRSFSEIFNG